MPKPKEQQNFWMPPETIREVYGLKPIKTLSGEKAIEYVYEVAYWDYGEFEILGFHFLKGGKENLGAFQAKVYADAQNRGGTRAWHMASLWYEDKPFMLCATAGRSPRDYSRAYITDRAVFEDFVRQALHYGDLTQLILPYELEIRNILLTKEEKAFSSEEVNKIKDEYSQEYNAFYKENPDKDQELPFDLRLMDLKFNITETLPVDLFSDGKDFAKLIKEHILPYPERVTGFLRACYLPSEDQLIDVNLKIADLTTFWNGSLEQFYSPDGRKIDNPYNDVKSELIDLAKRLAESDKDITRSGFTREEIFGTEDPSDLPDESGNIESPGIV